MATSEQDLLEVLENPALWIELVTGIAPRPYQRLILEESHKRAVLRVARRCGKTWTLAAHALWFAFCHSNKRVMVVYPYKEQVAVFFDEVRNMISRSSYLQASVDIDRRNPHEIRFYNGSYMRGFTAGTRAGAQAGTTRGQGADWLYLDEADYLDDSDWATLYALTLEDPENIGVWVASTPTGKRQFFYQLCTEGVKAGVWRQYHYTAMDVLPWNEAIEKDFRLTYPGEAFVHEVLAEFGEEEVGVFPKRLIDAARKEYIYSDSPVRGALYCMGVDWDKHGAATQIIILECIREAKAMFRVAKRVEIPRGDFTYDNAIRMIIDLNKVWNPSFIYVDRGQGEYQVEMLHRYGMQHPETGLLDKVKGIHFAEAIQVRDPKTGLLERKPCKPFMVSQLQILFEREQIELSDDDGLLWKQLENYRVKRVSQSGMPVFTSQSEHAVDALMLATLAFTLEFPDITRIVYDIKPTGIIKHVAHNPLVPPPPLVYPGLYPGVREWDEPTPPPPIRVGSRTGPLTWGPRQSGRFVRRRSF